MKTVTKLSIFALTVLLAGCNEKVSPELQQGNATTPNPVPIPPTEYYFSVTNTSDTMLGYKLHKTGAGNGSTPCEIKNTTGFSSDIFRGDLVNNDITCFFEAEELSLWHNGFSFDINASKNSCDYISYVPFGFYDYIPGDSTATYHQVTCGSPETTTAHIATAAARPGINMNVNDSSGTINCGSFVAIDSLLPEASRQAFQVESDEDLCAFNYTKDEGPNCDVGVITITELNVTYTPPVDAEPAVITQTKSSRTVRCGGAPAACVKGPTKELSDEDTMKSETTPSVLNEPMKVSYSYDGISAEKYSVKTYANYRRNLANKDINYGDQVVLNTPVWNAYKNAWNSVTAGKTYDPTVIDYFSNNLRPNGSTLVTTADINAYAVRDSSRVRRPLAADPFMGLYKANVQTKVNPFYSFYCLDKARDIKARIRMVVRDWDRVFPTNAGDLEFLSDLFRGTNSRQDIPFEREIPNDYDSYSWFNDLSDWDDWIPMSRTAGAFNVNTTIWRPLPNIDYPSGWFNEEYFTKGNE